MIRRAWLLLLLAAPAGAAVEAPKASTGTAVAVSTAAAGGEAFTAEAARRSGAPRERLEALRRKGFGKTEVLMMAELGKAWGGTWEELVKRREAGTPLRELSEEAGVDHDALFEKCRAFRREIDAALPRTETGAVRP